jgi:dolichol-phosphate mannosyltransferase
MDGRATWSTSLVIPAYNEEAGIQEAIVEADQALAELAADYEILVVDDGSDDDTARLVAETARARPRIRLLRHPHNRGYGAALRTGFQAARFDRIAFTDADCQFDLRDLAKLVPLTDQDPIAAGYRIRRQDAWRRCFLSRGYNLLVRCLLGTRVRDCDCALKVFQKEALRHLLPQTNGFFVNAEMLARARQRGYTIAEVGVRHRPRRRGRSTVSLGDIPRTLATLLPFWWSRVLFPAGTTDSKPQADANTLNAVASSPLAFGLVMLTAALLFFSRLHGPLLEPDEARYAEIPRQMLMEGRWIVPVLHGQPYCHKPPLLYWLVMMSYSVFGVHDWAARLVPCSAALFGIGVAYAWARRLVSSSAAFYGCLILCLSARFVYLGRMLTMDSLLCLWVLLGWAAAHRAVGQTALKWRWWLLSAAAVGLGLLTKGPVALALVAIPAAAFTLIDSRMARPGLGGWAAYLGLAAAVSLPWYVALSLREPTFAVDFFWTHNLRRFLLPLDHDGPVWYYLPGLLLGMLPWTLFLPYLARSLGRRSGVAMARRPASLGFFIITFLWCLVFYSAAGCKRPGYILPAMPPLALSLGWFLDSVLSRRSLRPARVGLMWSLNRLTFRATLLIVAIGLGLSWLAVSASLIKPAAGLLFGAAALTGLIYLWHRGPGQRVAFSLVGCAATTLALLLVGLHQVLPGYERKFSLRAQVRPRRHQAADREVPVACYPHRWDSVSFYLGRDDVRVYRAEERPRLIADLRRHPRTLLFVKSDSAQGRHLHDLLRQLPPSLEFVPLGDHGIVTRGLVRRRAEVPPFVYARR